jgi:putative oxidoreductase
VDVLFLIGRILFVVVFLGSAVAHLTDKGAMAGYAESRGVKPARPAVLMSGAMILVGAILVVLGVWIDLGAILLGLFTLSAAVLMHNFWVEKEPGARQTEMVQFMKDLALTGAALILLYVAWSLDGGGGFTLTDPLFDV